MTINDILKALECCSGYDPKCEDCPYRGIGMCESEIKEDAVLYLEEYKNLLDSQREENEPLTWDELKQMEGMPVWVESKYYDNAWEIVETVGTTRWSEGEFLETHRSLYRKEQQGDGCGTL